MQLKRRGQQWVQRIPKEINGTYPNPAHVAYLPGTVCDFRQSQSFNKITWRVRFLPGVEPLRPKRSELIRSRTLVLASRHYSRTCAVRSIAYAQIESQQ